MLGDILTEVDFPSPIGFNGGKIAQQGLLTAWSAALR